MHQPRQSLINTGGEARLILLQQCCIGDSPRKVRESKLGNFERLGFGRGVVKIYLERTGAVGAKVGDMGGDVRSGDRCCSSSWSNCLREQQPPMLM
jgi:hypothetical protein